MDIPAGPGQPEVVVVVDAETASVLAAERIGAALTRAVEARGRADWATTGGASAVGLYRAIAGAAERDTVPWSAVHTWWGDDRFVPRDHPLSNVKAFDDILLGIGGAEEGTAGGGQAGIGIHADHVHPFPTAEAIGRGLGAAWCAATLAETVRAADVRRAAGGVPVFDLVVLGIGGDGHMLSVFPGSPALGSDAVTMAIPAPTHIEPHVERVTFTPSIVAAATEMLVLVLGDAKAAILREVLGPWDPARLPAQLARRDGATWILDEAAAARLAR